VRELETSLDALVISQQDMPARHRSLRVVFDHSWRLLAEDTQYILCQLSVFRGGFSRDGASQVAAATLPLLATLLDTSLVRLVQEGRVARYEMQEVVRQYVAERLAADRPGAHLIRTRHSHYYLGLLQRAARELRRAGQQDMLASIQIEIDNVRIAWQWAASHSDAQGLVAASDGLFLFYEIRSWFQEGAEAFGQAAERLAEAATDKLNPTAQHAYAKLLACEGWFTFHLGRQQRARAMLGQSLDLMRDLGDPVALVFPLNYLAAVTYHGGAYEAARLLAMEALAVSQTCGDQDGIAVAQTILGQIAFLVGDYQAARSHSEASLALERALGNRWGTVFTLISLGRVALAERAFAEARHWFSEGLAIREAMGDGRGIGLCLRYLGDIATALGDHGEAQRLYQESLARFKAIGDQAGATTSLLIKLGYTALALHQQPASRSTFFEALREAWAIRATPETLDALAGIATVLAEDNPSQAYALATLVARHPAVTQESKARAETLQTDLVSTGFAPTSAALPNQNTVFALDPIVAALIGAA
jgi:tetratricopeptide (TPR) repeat protein